MGAQLRPDLDDQAFVALMPKVELHVHLEGTIAPETQLTIADRNRVELPYSTAQGVAEYQTLRRSEGRENLQNFLDCLDISRGVLRTAEDFHTIAVEFLRRCVQERVHYVEMMFDPQQAVRQGVGFEVAMDAISQARADAERDLDIRSQLILCFQRDHPAQEALRFIKAADGRRDQIVGIGLDNYETRGFPGLFSEAYRAANERDYRLTSHCDVNQPDSAQHIRACVDRLGVERIDHGLNAAEDPALIELLLEQGIALAACPTYYAGQDASPAWRLEMHRTLLEAGVTISLNTDDPAQFGSGWLSNTMYRAMRAAPFTRAEVVRFAQNAIDASWTDAAHKAELTAQLRDFVRA